MVTVESQQQGGGPLRMRRPVHVQQDYRPLVGLGDDGVQVKLGPVDR